MKVASGLRRQRWQCGRRCSAVILFTWLVAACVLQLQEPQASRTFGMPSALTKKIATRHGCAKHRTRLQKLDSGAEICQSANSAADDGDVDVPCDASKVVHDLLRGLSAASTSLLLLLGGGVPAPQGQPLQILAQPAYAEEYLNPEESQTVSLFEQNTPGVVFITSEAFQITDSARMQISQVPKGTGSGWVYDTDGHIVTNYHVIQGANAVRVRFIDGKELAAKVVGADPGTDVAVLQVSQKPTGSGQGTPVLTPLRRGKSAPLRVGQEVYAIGNPFGLDHTLTKGIVSGVGRTIMSIGGRPIQGAIQTDASINPGNSGGPLLNSRGEVIGMNTEIISPSGASAGVGFAIPSDTIAARAASILKYGYVKRPSLGVYLGTDGLSRVMTGQAGAFVASLQSKGAAGKAGIRPGDVIMQIDERRVERQNDVFAELDEHEPDDVVSVKLLRPDDGMQAALENMRDGVRNTFSEVTATVKLQEAPMET